MDDCIFCKIIRKEIKSELVYEDDIVCAFKDINPVSPIHLLIVPKLHIQSINECENNHKEILGHVFVVSKQLSKQFGIDETGYRIVVNCGSDAGQTVKHVHFHLMGGRKFSWPAG